MTPLCQVLPWDSRRPHLSLYNSLHTREPENYISQSSLQLVLASANEKQSWGWQVGKGKSYFSARGHSISRNAES